MDKPFIQSMVDAYFIDNKIYENEHINQELLTNQILNEVRLLRKNDIEFYENLYNTNRLDQQRVIKNYLDLCLNELDYEEEITESVLLSGAIIVGSFLTVLQLLAPGKITNTTMKIAHSVAKNWQSVTRWMNTWGGDIRVRYAVVKKNLDKCYRECGVAKDDITLGHYAAVSKDTPWWGSLSSLKKRKQGECLRDCYIGYMIDTIDLYMKNYFECLKKTGVDITNAEDDIMKFISRLGTTGVCEQFYKYAQTMFEEFEKVLDMIYSKSEFDDRKDRDIIYKKLREKLYHTRKQVQQQR